MTDCNEAMRPLHDRMPVLLHQNEYEQWLRGSLDDVIAFQKRCFPELWVKKRVSTPSETKPPA